MQVAVTGAAGFMGRRVVDALKAKGHNVLPLTHSDSVAGHLDAVKRVDALIHLAGVNRPTDPAEFVTGNAELTEQLASAVDAKRAPIVVFASSTQATLDNPYGASKRRGEVALETLASRGGRVAIFRLPNVFGPGGRPNYNSAIATFAYNAANGLPLQVNDASRELTLVYVHDVVAAFMGVLDAPPPKGRHEYRSVATEHRATVGGLADTFRGFAESRENFRTPDVTTPFGRELYATFVSCLAPDRLGYDLLQRTDNRGTLAEFLKSSAAGQVFVSRTKPGITRGNHYHHTKTEKFLVVEGDAVVRFRRVDGTGTVASYPVSGKDFRVVDIPPDHTHSIENVGSAELIVLFWACEVFDPQAPDTNPLNVLT